MNLFSKFFGRAGPSLAAVGGIALLVMTMWTVVDVATRYLLDKPLRGSIDLVESTLVLVVFLALPECFRRDEQITVDVIDHVTGNRTVASLKLFASLAMLAFVALLAYTGIQPLLDAYRFGDRKPDFPVPIFGLLIAIELALVVSAVVLAGKLVARGRDLLAGNVGRQGPSKTTVGVGIGIGSPERDAP